MASWFWRRRNYLIDKEFQFRYMGRIIFGMMIMALIIAFTVYYTTWARIMDEFYNIPRVAAQFAPLFASVNQTLLLVLVLFVALAALSSLFISHSIAGPIYRFEKTLQAITKGDLTLRVGLRKTDEFKHVADTLNIMMEQLRTTLNEDQKLIGEMTDVTRRLAETSGRAAKDIPAPVAKDLERLEQMLGKLRQSVDRFKLHQTDKP
jgi:methyl-accepting chemotaxis protein